jgi:hypothetical protein
MSPTNNNNSTYAGSGYLFTAGLGSEITAADTISLAAAVTVVIGSATINTINGGTQNANLAYLVRKAGASWALGNDGNIVGPLPATFAEDSVISIVWDGTSWRVSAASTEPVITIYPTDTDNTAAVIAGCAALQAAGTGVLIFTPGTHRLFEGMSAGPGILGSFSNLNNIKILGYGAKLLVDPGFTYTTNVSGAIFAFSNTVGMTIDGFQMSGPPAPNDGAYKGVAFVLIFPGCRNITLGRNSVDGAAAGVIFYAGGVAGSNKYSNVDLGQLEVKNAYYGVNGQWGPDNMRGTIITESVTRSYFVYGCAHHDVTVISKNPHSNDAFIASSQGYGCEDIQLDYTLIDTGTTGAGAVGVLLDWDNTAGYLRNIDVRLNCTFGGGGSGALLLQKTDGSGAYDTVDRGHTLTNLKVSGYVSGQPVTNAFGVVGTNPNCDWNASGTPDVWSNIKLEDLTMTGQTSPSIWYLGAVVDQFTLDNVSSVRGIRCQHGFADSNAPKNGRVIAGDNNKIPNLYDYYVTDAALGLRMISVTGDRAIPLGWFGGNRIIHNKYAGVTVKVTLPAATPGLRATFANFLDSGAGVYFRVDPNGSETIRGGDAGKYLQIYDTGDSRATLFCATAGIWEVESSAGTVTFEP